jgi:signal transduction histidine kinase
MKKRTKTRELEARERQALELHDSLLQGLTAILWAIEAGAYEQARDLTAAALAQAQGMIGDLLQDHPEGHTFAPGALRRERAA